MRLESPVSSLELIRFSAENTGLDLLERESPHARAVFQMPDTAVVRRALLSHSLLLSDAMAPGVNEAAREAMKRLGVPGAIEIFQTKSNHPTARLALHSNPIGVEFFGNELATLDPPGLLAVIGHEIGHAIAHSAHPRFAWAMSASQAARSGAQRHYAMAAEITADRFGLLACRDVDAALRLEMHSATGASITGISFDTRSYAEQCSAFCEDLLRSSGAIVGATHPEHYVRGYAEWLFSETDVYASLTGVGTARRSLRDVDAILCELLSRTALPPKPHLQAPKVDSPPTASVGTRDDEPAWRDLVRNASLEDVAVDVLADSARRKVATAADAMSTLARRAGPTVERWSNVARARLVGSSSSSSVGSSEPRAMEEESVMDDERRELEARFEELERSHRDK